MTDKAETKREIELITALVELQVTAFQALVAFEKDHAAELSGSSMQYVLSKVRGHVRASLDDLYEDRSSRQDELNDLERSETAAWQREREREIKAFKATRQS